MILDINTQLNQWLCNDHTWIYITVLQNCLWLYETVYTWIYMLYEEINIMSLKKMTMIKCNDLWIRNDWQPWVWSKLYITKALIWRMSLTKIFHLIWSCRGRKKNSLKINGTRLKCKGINSLQSRWIKWLTKSC